MIKNLDVMDIQAYPCDDMESAGPTTNQSAVDGTHYKGHDPGASPVR